MPISLKNMRGCASPASTAICSSTTDHRSMIRHSPAGTPGRHHRLNSYLQDQYNHLIPANAAPCISELPITPRALYRKGSSLKKHFANDAPAAGDSARRKSSAEIREYLSSSRRRRSAEIRRSPPGSSMYLLGDTASFRAEDLALVPSEPVEEVREVGPTTDLVGQGVVGKRGDLVRSAPVYRRDPDRSRALVPGHALVKPLYKGSTCAAAAAADRQGNQRLGLRERGAVKSSSAPPSGHQVVVLRVSLHCKGCVGKLRKHLSKMEGVTSFSIDLETKRVTVTGSVSPLDVLTSISKVMKNAQFWPSPATSPSSFSSSSSSVLSRSGFNSM